MRYERDDRNDCGKAREGESERKERERVRQREGKRKRGRGKKSVRVRERENMSFITSLNEREICKDRVYREYNEGIIMHVYPSGKEISRKWLSFKDD